jgi:hypothetical protein
MPYKKARKKKPGEDLSVRLMFGNVQSTVSEMRLFFPSRSSFAHVFGAVVVVTFLSLLLHTPSEWLQSLLFFDDAMKTIDG